MGHERPSADLTKCDPFSRLVNPTHTTPGESDVVLLLPASALAEIEAKLARAGLDTAKRKHKQ